MDHRLFDPEHEPRGPQEERDNVGDVPIGMGPRGKLVVVPPIEAELDIPTED